MEALIMAGGKGSRMRELPVEKPMIEINGIPSVERMIHTLRESGRIDRILVSVSHNTPLTERHIADMGIEVIMTTGDDYVSDLHEAFRLLEGRYVLTIPADMPLLHSSTVSSFIDHFERNPNDSMTAIIREDVVIEAGMTPSYAFDLDGERWVLSGMNIMDRQKILDGVVVDYDYYRTDSVDLAMNMNTPGELAAVRSYLY